MIISVSYYPTGFLARLLASRRRIPLFSGLFFSDLATVTAAWLLQVIGNGFLGASPAYGFNILTGTTHGTLLQFIGACSLYVAMSVLTAFSTYIGEQDTHQLTYWHNHQLPQQERIRDDRPPLGVWLGPGPSLFNHHPRVSLHRRRRHRQLDPRVRCDLQSHLNHGYVPVALGDHVDSDGVLPVHGPVGRRPDLPAVEDHPGRQVHTCE